MLHGHCTTSVFAPSLQDLCRLESTKASLLSQLDAVGAEGDGLDLVLDTLDLLGCLYAMVEEGGAEWDLDVRPEEFVSQKLNQKLLQQIQVKLGRDVEGRLWREWYSLLVR